jgi:hypothetical protein
MPLVLDDESGATRLSQETKADSAVDWKGQHGDRAGQLGEIFRYVWIVEDFTVS